MNRAHRRAYRRLGWPEKRTATHECTSLTRHKELDHTVRSDDEPPTDFFGYRCQCGRFWVQMQYSENGEKKISWRATDELKATE